MRVFYKLEPEDVVRLIAEKYGIKNAEERIRHVDDNCYMVDMSDTETPGEFRNEQAKAKKERIEHVPDKKVLGTLPEDEKTLAMEERYKSITDKVFKGLLSQGKKITEICEIYDLDQKHKWRLYDRAKRFRSEGVSKTGDGAGDK